jgi:hypothetical protein
MDGAWSAGPTLFLVHQQGDVHADNHGMHCLCVQIANKLQFVVNAKSLKTEHITPVRETWSKCKELGEACDWKLDSRLIIVGYNDAPGEAS